MADWRNADAVALEATIRKGVWVRVPHWLLNEDLFYGPMAELLDARDSKSLSLYGSVGWNPTRATLLMR